MTEGKCGSRRGRLGRLLRLAGALPKANPGQSWAERKAKALAGGAKAPAVPREAPGAEEAGPGRRPARFEDRPLEERRAALELCLARLRADRERMRREAQEARKAEQVRQARRNLASWPPVRRIGRWNGPGPKDDGK